jgi:hypothetical protein
VLTLVLDAVQKYEGYFGDPSICRLRVYALPGRRAVAVVTALAGAPTADRAGPLATATLCLAALVFDADPDDIVWVEHYQGGREDRYARVRFDWDDRECVYTNPSRKYVTRESVEALIGQSLGGDGPDPLAN